MGLTLARRELSGGFDNGRLRVGTLRRNAHLLSWSLGIYLQGSRVPPLMSFSTPWMELVARPKRTDR